MITGGGALESPGIEQHFKHLKRMFTTHRKFFEVKNIRKNVHKMSKKRAQNVVFRMFLTSGARKKFSMGRKHAFKVFEMLPEIRAF